MTSNSIPTPYGGVIFRSRTEARWAVFFDRLDIKWDYEIQGFDTDGQWYLPDFLVFPALGRLWVEIKPNWREDPDGIAKFRRFAGQRPQPSRAALIAGLPTLHNRPLVLGGDDDSDDPLKGAWEAEDMEWRPCGSGHHFDLAYPGTFGAKFAEDECPDNFGGLGEERIRKASEAALSHRFSSKSDDANPPAA